MREPSKKRELVENEGEKHAVKRGWRGLFHFENMPWLEKVFDKFLKISSMRKWGEKNALNLQVNKVEFSFPNLPIPFDGVRLLLLTDFHIDEFDELVEKVERIVTDIEYDYCILGGDYSFGRGESLIAYNKMAYLAKRLVKRSRVFGILGNHDYYSVAEALQEMGVEMLINDSVSLERDGQRIYLVGVDDCHYFGTQDLELAHSAILDGEFKMVISHSPECYKVAEDAGYSFFMAGHTHGGQVCLPGGIAIVTGATVPRRILHGKWRFGEMAGYTSRGVGASGVGVRYFCRPEIVVLTLNSVAGS